MLEPLNIWSRSDEEVGRLMSHFAHTPFVLDGVAFGSVEAFYTWLLVSPEKRPKVAPMWGTRAKYKLSQVHPESFDYHGERVVTHSQRHHELILAANRAKLDAHPQVARAFVATAPRPIVHHLPEKDDEHEIFCWIMNRLRDEYAGRVSPAVESGIEP